MLVLGISASPRAGETTERLVRAVLSGVEGAHTEFVSLAGRRINPCIACLGCVGDNVCRVMDGMAKIRPLLVEADALVFGAANYYGVLNGLAHCFLERFYQFRHRGEMTLAGKLGVAVGVGGGNPGPPADYIEGFFTASGIETVDRVTAIGTACCYVCGHGPECEVGAVIGRHGRVREITAEMIPDLSRQRSSLEQAAVAGKKLSAELRNGVRAE